MPQLHLYVSAELAELVRQRAASEGLSVSRYLARLVKDDLGAQWPEGYFEEVAGGWSGPPLTRADQGELEERDPL